MRHSLVIVSLAALVVGVYWGIWTFDFVDFDDNVYLTENPVIDAGLTLDTIVWAFTTGHHSNWHPLTWLSYLAEISLFGLDPSVMHVTNVAIHFLNALLLYLLLWRSTGAVWRSAVVGLLFVVHPLHVESVAWISERKELLGACFALMALHAYVSDVRLRRSRYLVASVVFFALSLMAKPMWVSLPILLLLFDRWPLGRRESWKHLGLEKLPYVAVAAMACIVTLVVQRGGESVQSLGVIPLAQRVGNAVLAYGVYLGQTLWPANLAVFYPHHRGELSWMAVSFTGVALFVVTIVVFLGRRRFPSVWMGWAWFGIALLPVIGIVQVGGQAFADRYSYVPHIGLFAGMVWAFPSSLAFRPVPRLLAASCGTVLILGAALLSFWQVRCWRDTETLFLRATAVTDDNVLAHTILGRWYLDEGRLAAAEAHATAALNINPEYSEGWLELGKIHYAQSRHREGANALSRYLDARPDSASAWYYLARSLDVQGDSVGAGEAFVRSLEAQPGNAVVRTAYGNHLARRAVGADGVGLDVAAAQFGLALEADPDYRLAHLNLGRTLALLGQDGESRSHLERAAELAAEMGGLGASERE